MKKVVCHITSVHPAHDVRIYHKECISLVNKGYHVHLVAHGSLPKDAKGIIHHVISINPKSGRLKRIIFRARQAYMIAKSIDADIYHFHDPELLPYGLLLKKQGYKVIYDAHEDLPRDIMIKTWIPLICRKPICWFMEKFENFVASRLDAVVAATPKITNRFRSINANTVEVKNFPRLEEMKTPAYEEVEHHTTPFICYVGLISIKRGILEMIRAIEHLNVKLILAGSFDNQNTKQLAYSLPGWSKVEYYNFVSRQEVASIYAKSRIGLCLLHNSHSYMESLPIKLFEYMSSGLPVIASNFDLWKNIVEKTKCGVCVDPFNITQIQHNIELILSNPLLANTMGKNGKKSIETSFNWQFEEQQLLSIYSLI